MAGIEDILGGLFGGVGSAISSGITASAMDEISRRNEQRLKEAADRINAIGLPEFSKQGLSPQDVSLALLGTPEEATYQTVDIDPRIRDAQLSALQQLQNRISGVADSELNAENYAAMANASNLAKGREDAILQNALSRGVGGSGLEFALRQQASQSAANNAQQGMLEAARTAALQRLQGTQDYLQGMGNLRNQDTSQAAKNADIINQFNMANTAARNAASAQNVGIQNQQNVMNTQAKNAASQYNIGRSDQNAMNRFNANLGRESAAAGLVNQGVNYSQNAANQQALIGLAGGQGAIEGLGRVGQGIYDMYNPVSEQKKKKEGEQ